MRVLKVSVHMNHLSVIGTEKHVGQRINRLPCCAEYSLSDTNRKKKIILRILAAVEILISSLSLLHSLLQFRSLFFPFLLLLLSSICLSFKLLYRKSAVLERDED